MYHTRRGQCMRVRVGAPVASRVVSSVTCLSFCSLALWNCLSSLWCVSSYIVKHNSLWFAPLSFCVPVNHIMVAYAVLLIVCIVLFFVLLCYPFDACLALSRVAVLFGCRKYILNRKIFREEFYGKSYIGEEDFPFPNALPKVRFRGSGVQSRKPPPWLRA